MKNTKNILLGEIYAAFSYNDRILQALIELTGQEANPELVKELKVLDFDLREIIETKILNPSLTSKEPQDLSVRELREGLRVYQTLIESLVKMDCDHEQLCEVSSQVMNKLYSSTQKLHTLLQSITSAEIQLPRPGIATIVENKTEKEIETEEKPFVPFSKSHLTLVVSNELDSDEDVDDLEAEDIEIPLYQVKVEDLIDSSKNRTSVLELTKGRDQRHENHIQKGHEFVYKKDYESALAEFFEALEFKESAEVLTLIAWVYGLDQKFELAKSYCLKAIKKDPDYGPPYNDLGSLLLNEGHYKESLKWFNLAKKAIKYQNKEFPFINSGRAYMMLRDVDRALEEFETALKIAPFNDELKQTVQKIKKGLEHPLRTEQEKLNDLLGEEDQPTD